MKDEEKIYGEDGKMPLKNDLKDQEKEGADLPSPEKSGEEEEKRRPAAAEKRSLLWNWSVSLRKIKVSAPS